MLSANQKTFIDPSPSFHDFATKTYFYQKLVLKPVQIVFNFQPIRRRLLETTKDNSNNELNKKMVRAAKILERMVNQNTFDDIAQGSFNF